jgi:hypothetical protein
MAITITPLSFASEILRERPESLELRQRNPHTLSPIDGVSVFSKLGRRQQPLVMNMNSTGKSRLKPAHLFAVLAVAGCLGMAPARGHQTYSWTGGGGNGDWFDADNWGGSVPVVDFFDPNNIHLTTPPAFFEVVNLQKSDPGLQVFAFGDLVIAPDYFFSVENFSDDPLRVGFTSSFLESVTDDQSSSPAVHVQSLGAGLTLVNLGELAASNWQGSPGSGTLRNVYFYVDGGILQFDQNDGFGGSAPLTDLDHASVWMKRANINAANWQDSLPALKRLSNESTLAILAQDYTFAGDVSVDESSQLLVSGGTIRINGVLTAGGILTYDAFHEHLTELGPAYFSLWPDYGPATLVIANADYSINHAYIDLAGVASAITDQDGNNALRHLAVNTGAVSARQGQNLVIESAALANSGWLGISEEASVSISGTLTNTGTGVINLAEYLGAGGPSVLQVGGLVNHAWLIGTGQIVGQVESDGVIDVAAVFGAQRTQLSVLGNVSLLDGGTIRFHIGLIDTEGDAFTSLNIAGQLTLGGNLEVYFDGINAVDPSLTFTIITSGPQTGAFANVSFGGQVPVFDGSGATLGFFDVLQDGGNIVLTHFVPEPGTCLLVLLGGVGFFARRRR